MKHVHDRKILHRDIKCQNVFLTKQGIIKLGDFGIARVLRHTNEVSRSMVGTPYYLSPEIIEGRPYSFKSDIWSLGVMLYEMCALKPPFEGLNMHFLAMHIVRGKFQPIPSHFSRELRELVDHMLTIDVNKRPTINKILQKSVISVRIKKFLEQDTFKDEFSHTILHRKQVILGNPEDL
jgi:NIMA (never in mitosis gene a)-related kinase